MKDARNDPKDEAGAPGTGAAIVAPGALPQRVNTVRAEVLARLLAGERLTGLDAVSSAGTTRLAAVIHALSAIGWRVDRDDIPVTCRDGRAAHVTAYWIRADQREAARAGDWIQRVQLARLESRGASA